MNLENITLRLPLKVQNKYPFPLNINSILLEIYSDANFSERVGLVEDSTQLTLDPGKENTLRKDVKLNTLKTGISGIFKTLKNELDYYIKGNISISFGKNTMIIPLREKIIIDLLNGKIKQ